VLLCTPQRDRSALSLGFWLSIRLSHHAYARSSTSSPIFTPADAPIILVKNESEEFPYIV
jgi:hypothetical protein